MRFLKISQSTVTDWQQIKIKVRDFLSSLYILGMILYPALLYLEVLPSTSYRYVLVVGAFFFVLLALFSAVPIEQLGLDSPKRGIKSWVVMTISGVVLLTILSFMPFVVKPDNPERTKITLFYLFISAPLQELIYRGFLSWFLEKNINDMFLEVLVAGVIFAWGHIMFGSSWFLSYTLVIGVVWYFMFKRTKNLYGAVISHAILGTLAGMLGLI